MANLKILHRVEKGQSIPRFCQLSVGQKPKIYPLINIFLSLLSLVGWLSTISISSVVPVQKYYGIHPCSKFTLNFTLVVTVRNKVRKKQPTGQSLGRERQRGNASPEMRKDLIKLL